MEDRNLSYTLIFYNNYRAYHYDINSQTVFIENQAGDPVGQVRVNESEAKEFELILKNIEAQLLLIQS